MKKICIGFLLCITLLLCACSNAGVGTVAKGSPTSTPTESFMPNTGVSGQATASAAASASPAASASKSSLYDPSIFVIEASVKWQDELAKGYNSNNECEIYLQKIDANDNRQVVGSYDGCFWMKTTLDTSEFIKEMLKDVPMEASFDAGGEAVADNLAISLNTSDDKAWVDYAIKGEDGKPLPLTQDTPVAKGSFVAVTKSVYLEAHANGAQGEKVDYSDAKDGEVMDINYVIHVQPDSQESSGQRKVIINLSGENFNKTIEGVMKRLPGTTEDVSKYLNSDEYKNSAWKHING